MGEALTSNLQQRFFSSLKEAVPANISFVDEIAEVLDIGYDSVYRRIRGEKPITLTELKILCDHFHISLDQVLQLHNDSIVFHAPGINDDLTFDQYLSGILDEFKYFNSFANTEMIYLCKDLPIWHFFLFPEIAAFKLFCWMKTIQNLPEFQHKTFSLEDFRYHEYYKKGQQILAEFNRIACTELWSYETISSTINQLQYYREAKLFANPQDYDAVTTSLVKMLTHLRDEAEAGVKFSPGTAANLSRVKYELYVNEVLVGNNTTLVFLDGRMYCYINYNGLNYFKTADTRFTARTLKHLTTLTSRSSLISGTGEKFRNSYFESLLQKIAAQKKEGFR